MNDFAGALSPTPTPTGSGGYAFDFCMSAIPILEQMNAVVHKGRANSFGDMVWGRGVWPGPATINNWNKVLATINKQATAEGKSDVASDAFEAQMIAGYNPRNDGDSGAIGLGNETMNIVMACAPGGQETGVSAVDSYRTSDGFTWYPGD